MVVSVYSIRAIPLAEYRQNVHQAMIALDALQSSGARERLASEPATLAEVRRLLPASQKVELSDKSTLDVDNSWLEKRLKEYQSESLGAENKTRILLTTAEQLGAIENRLDELEKAAAGNYSKNNDKQKLDEILRRPEFKKPEKSLWQQWWENFWKSDKKPPEEAERPAQLKPTTELAALGSILRYLVIALALAAIGFILWRFVLPLLRRSNRKTTKRQKREPRVILGEELAQDATSNDLLTEAENLARSGNIRAAIRKGYIALLCELNDRKILGLAKHKTNRDYLRDVQKRDSILQPMLALTNSFEQHWYGDVPAKEDDWQEFRAKYQQAVSNER